MLAVLLTMFLGSSCRVRTTTPPPQRTPPQPEPTQVGQQVEEMRASILLSESHLSFAKQAAWTRGPETHVRLIENLQRGLADRGVETDLLSEDGIAGDTLCGYNLLYVVDAVSISAEAEIAIRHFVKHGGLLVGLNEVGRVQADNWTKPWHYEDIFGVTALEIDEFGTALSSGHDLFTRAELTPDGRENPLLQAFGASLFFGEASGTIWATKPTTATVLASFPAYRRQDRLAPHTPSVVEEPAIAVSINAFGLGKAVWISPNVHNRDPDSWEQAGDALALLAACAQIAQPGITIPPQPERVYLALSQVGFYPGASKLAIIRVARRKDPPFAQGQYRVVSEATHRAVAGGTLRPDSDSNPWGDCVYIADFSNLQEPGSYRFEADLDGKDGTTHFSAGPFPIASDPWEERVIPTQLDFLRSYRCGTTCHTNDPVRGGYHDATGDYAVRMWSMPHVAYGLAEYVLCRSGQTNRNVSDATQELAWCTDWLVQMIDPDGRVFLSVKPEKEWSPVELRPPADPTRRILEKGTNLNYQTTYVVGMAHAARALRDIDPRRAAQAGAAARRALDPLARRQWNRESTGELGNYIWASAELYRLDGRSKDLERVRTAAESLLARQLTDASRVEGGLRGDFLNASGSEFGDRQYKRFHAFGVYYGLLELADILPDGDPLRTQILAALELFFEDFVLRGASLTPYGQVAVALELESDGRFHPRFFSHKDSWIRLHGLNCDLLGMGLAALKYDQLTGQKRFQDLARTQAEWVAGLNPFGWSMIDFVGWTNAPMLSNELGTGRFEGGIPNGIVGDGHDRPSWGASWDSREYWLPHNAYLIALIPRLRD